MVGVSTSAPDTASASDPVPAPARRRRRGGTVGDMIRSFGLLLVIVVIIVLVRGQGGGEKVRTIDPTQAYDGAAHVASYTLRVPTGLPKTWRATSAASTQAEGQASGPVTLTVGFVTPDADYAQLTESNAAGLSAAADLLPAQARRTGVTTIDGERWQVWPSAKSAEQVLLRRSGGVLIAVTGNASRTEFSQLIASLAPYRMS